MVRTTHKQRVLSEFARASRKQLCTEAAHKSTLPDEDMCICKNCGDAEYENDKNGTLVYGCISMWFCSDCYADEKANHPDFEENDAENDEENDKNDENSTPEKQLSSEADKKYARDADGTIYYREKDGERKIYHIKDNEKWYLYQTRFTCSKCEANFIGYDFLPQEFPSGWLIHGHYNHSGKNYCSSACQENDKYITFN